MTVKVLKPNRLTEHQLHYIHIIISHSTVVILHVHR